MKSVLRTIIIFMISCFALTSCGNSKGNTTMTNSAQESNSNLFIAIDKQDSKIVKEILSSTPNLEIKDNKGRTALMIATYNEDTAIAEMLITAGANVNAQDKMLNSPFLYAGASGFVPILKLCLANGADFNIFNRYGGSALIPAAERRHVEVVQILTQTPNFPIDHINNLGWTAIMEAIILGSKSDKQTEIVKILVDAGCDYTIPDNDGITPLQHAKSKSLDQVVAILLNADTDKAAK